MKRILVTYATMSGSTSEVERVVSQEIAKYDAHVDVLPLDMVKSLDGYDGVVLGAPMIMGWHRAALGFLKKHRAEWQHIPLAVFIMGMSLTQTGETGVDGVTVTVDEKLAKSPVTPGHLSFKERYARVSNYVRPILDAVRPVKPVSIGLFGGRLEYGRLPWWAVLFVTVVIQAPAGERRNWAAIRAWAAGLGDAFQLRPMNTAAVEAEGVGVPQIA